MQLSALDDEQIYKLFAIETDKTGAHWVTDKTGPNVVCSQHFETMVEAQHEWARRVEAFLTDSSQSPSSGE